jgi:catechol O-methyltransferase
MNIGAKSNGFVRLKRPTRRQDNQPIWVSGRHNPATSHTRLTSIIGRRVGDTIVAFMDLKRRIPLLRWSFLRMATANRNFSTTGQVGDGREAAAVDYVVQNARAGDIDDVIATIDKYAYEKSMLINVGDEKGKLLDAAVQRANPALALELGTYCGYGALRIARAAPDAKVYSVELAESNAANARHIWAHAGVADRVTCVVGTIGDGGRTLDVLADQHGFASGALEFVFIDHHKDAYLDDLQSIIDRGWLHL